MLLHNLIAFTAYRFGMAYREKTRTERLAELKEYAKSREAEVVEVARDAEAMFYETHSVLGIFSGLSEKEGGVPQGRPEESQVMVFRRGASFLASP